MSENIINKSIFFQTEITETGRAVVNFTWNEFVGFFPYYRVYYIADGEADIILSDKSMRLKKGNIYFIPAFSIKSVKLISETLDHIWIHFTVGSGLARYLETAEKVLSYPAEEADVSAFKKIIEYSDGVHPESVTKNAAVTGLLSYLLAKFFIGSEHTADSKEKMRFIPVLEYIDENLSGKIENEELCKLVFLSKIYFSNLFTKQFGKSPKQYVQEKKMMTAATLLVATDKPIKEIAEEVGYIDDAYFNRSFAKFTHMTPGAYRKTLGSMAKAKIKDKTKRGKPKKTETKNKPIAGEKRR